MPAPATNARILLIPRHEVAAAAPCYHRKSFLHISRGRYEDSRERIRRACQHYHTLTICIPLRCIRMTAL